MSHLHSEQDSPDLVSASVVFVFVLMLMLLLMVLPLV
jgi:hypothetical protein